MKKAKACGNSNSCVFVGALPGEGPVQTLVVVMGDDDQGPKLTFTRAEWDAFVDGVKAGEFDTDTLVLEAARS